MSNTSNQLLAPNTTTKFCLMFNPNGPCKHNSVLRISLQSDEKRNESVLLSGADARTLEYELHAECKPIRDWSFDLKKTLHVLGVNTILLELLLRSVFRWKSAF